MDVTSTPNGRKKIYKKEKNKKNNTTIRMHQCMTSIECGWNNNVYLSRYPICLWPMSAAAVLHMQHVMQSNAVGRIFQSSVFAAFIVSAITTHAKTVHGCWWFPPVHFTNVNALFFFSTYQANQIEKNKIDYNAVCVRCNVQLGAQFPLSLTHHRWVLQT